MAAEKQVTARVFGDFGSKVPYTEFRGKVYKVSSLRTQTFEEPYTKFRGVEKNHILKSAEKPGISRVFRDCTQRFEVMRGILPR